MVPWAYPDGIGNDLVEFDNWTSLHDSPLWAIGHRPSNLTCPTIIALTSQFTLCYFNPKNLSLSNSYLFLHPTIPHDSCMYNFGYAMLLYLNLTDTSTL